MSSTAVRAAVCAAVFATQMGVSLRQSSGTVPLWHRHSDQSAILFTSVIFSLLVFRSRANLVEQQFRICVVIGCRLPDAEKIAHAGSAFRRWIIGN